MTNKPNCQYHLRGDADVEELYDGHGIYLCLACPKCKQDKLGRYRPDIMERYECDEQIEAEDGERHRNADRIDGYDRDDLGDSPDY
jgi:hypothetical protein